eukprot:TRINITY_DN61412_c0_g1_i1.p1 TRINITY_DN61412_c0_g1~~TRINITY_DN61412_c0_g1_i1.p1  ORF type:complete len:655 (-),score=92.91 TRINITY_DN61412_c0_g1_i1:358-2268(-)
MAQQGVHELQRAAIIKMLSIGAAEEQHGGAAQTFKVLVYDKFCQDVIAPLLKVGGLRKHGVTLNLNLSADRLPVTDTPVVYFVEPTVENIDKINDDIKKQLYESCYINFASAVPRSLLDKLARGAMEANAANKIAGVFDRYISFVSLGSSLFSLNLPGAYETIHSPIDDRTIERYIERIVDGLLSVLVATRALPVIRCPPGFAAEMVGRRLDERIRDLLSRGGANSDLFSGGGAAGVGRPGVDAGAGSQRPLLCLFDRDLDLVTMLGHTWTYQAMCHDLLNLKLNQLSVPADDVGSSGKMTQLFVDDSDTFWAAHAGEMFPNVATAVDRTIEEFKKKSAEMTAKTGDKGFGDSIAPAIAEAINMLPELTEKRRSMERHTNIAHALLNLVKVRQLDRYYQLEDLFSSQYINTSVSQLEQLIGESDAGTPMDKTRALMVLYLTKPSLTSAQMQSLTDALREAGGDTSGVSYLQHLASLKNMMAPSAASSAVPASTSTGIMSNIGGLANRMKSTGGGLFDNFKNIVASNKELAICGILDSLMEHKQNPETDRYLYLDPKAPQAPYGSEQPRVRSPFKKAIAFVVGGGSYVEMQSIQEWAQAHSRQMIYGATDMVTPHQFVEELCSLGQGQGESNGVDLT